MQDHFSPRTEDLVCGSSPMARMKLKTVQRRNLVKTRSSDLSSVGPYYLYSKLFVDLSYLWVVHETISNEDACRRKERSTLQLELKLAE